VAIKPYAETAARKASLNPTSHDDNYITELNIFSLDRISALSNDEIIDRIEAIESQSWLLKSRLLWELRKRYPSDKEFGQYIKAWLTSTRHLVASSQSQITNLVSIGRFCEETRIDDMGSIKVYQKSLLALSQLEDTAVAKKILRNIVNKNLPVEEVKRVIYQETVVHTIENEPVEVIDYGEPKPTYVIPVIDNIAVGADLYVQQVWPDNIDIEPQLTIMVDDSHFANSRTETIEDRVDFEVTRILDMGLSITENIKKADELIDIASKVKAHFLNMRYPKK